MGHIALPRRTAIGDFLARPIETVGQSVNRFQNDIRDVAHFEVVATACWKLISSDLIIDCVSREGAIGSVRLSVRLFHSVL